MQQRLKTSYPGTKVYMALVPQALSNQQNWRGGGSSCSSLEGCSPGACNILDYNYLSA